MQPRLERCFIAPASHNQPCGAPVSRLEKLEALEAVLVIDSTRPGREPAGELISPVRRNCDRVDLHHGHVSDHARPPGTASQRHSPRPELDGKRPDYGSSISADIDRSRIPSSNASCWRNGLVDMMAGCCPSMWLEEFLCRSMCGVGSRACWLLGRRAAGRRVPGGGGGPPGVAPPGGRGRGARALQTPVVCAGGRRGGG